MDRDDSGLDIDDAASSGARPGSALERIKQVSHALSHAARRSRLSNRRGGYGGGGFRARRGARLMRWLVISSFFVVFVAPSLAAAVYYFFVASDQYVSEADFIVSSGETPMPDGFASLTGVPAIAIIQDTQIVINYIHSRAALEKLDSAIHIRDLYADPKADALARFNPEKPIEQFLKYWNKMSDSTIIMPAGIVQLKVRAFTPQDAQKIAQASVELCEQLVNDLNARMNQDAVANAEQELQRSSQRLSAALAALESARNQSGILETDKSADALISLVKDARTNLLSMEGQYRSQLNYVQATAPQMKELNSRIEVSKRQLAEIEAKLTSTVEADGGDPTLSKSMTKFGELDLERKVSERLYAGAAASLEIARVTAENKAMYFKTFVSPVVPQEALYPKRALNTFLVFASSLAAWGVLSAFGLLVRNYMA